jgi:hypothetical protein
MIAAFDIGIKNLAWCIYDPDKKEIQHWENTNLITDSQQTDTNTATCCVTCQKTAKYITVSPLSHSAYYYCKRHCPAAQPILTDSSGGEIKKLPTVLQLQDFLTARQRTVPKKREDIIQCLSQFYSLPLWSEPYLTDKPAAKKEKKATRLSFDELHDIIIAFVNKNSDKFRDCKRILLENQPVLKNPVMKTVQVFLYAELRSSLIRMGVKPSFELVHAKKKVAAAKGDEGYSDRKKGSEARASAALDAALKDGRGHAREWKDHFAAAKKKSDLADAFCMCMDASN